MGSWNLPAVNISLLFVRISFPFTLLNVLFAHVTGIIPVSFRTCSPGGSPLIVYHITINKMVDMTVSCLKRCGKTMIPLFA